jgi:hypothetical protein
MDNLIATARSNKVVVCLGFQDFLQLNRDYGDKESMASASKSSKVKPSHVVAEKSGSCSRMNDGKIHFI